MTAKQPKLYILGTRGVPAQHGGFETFAEYLALWLTNAGWSVTVYCQESGVGSIWEDEWHDVRLVHVPVSGEGAKATIVFDYLCVRHALTQKGTFLTLGYNTAIFNLLFRLKGKVNIFNMDGIEWKRDKWKWYERVWLYLNERAGCWIGQKLIADHPAIADHLSTRVRRDKIVMIPYGAEFVDEIPDTIIRKYGLSSKNYSIVIARPEPENSIFEIVHAFSARKRGSKLVVLGRFEPEKNSYHQKVVDAASEEVAFLGAIYDKETVSSLRYHATLYIHGHTVGGTNPSLVEALGAGAAILAHDNRFNRWVAGDEQCYFSDKESCEYELTALLGDKERLRSMEESARRRYQEQFTWEKILHQYEQLLLNAAHH